MRRSYLFLRIQALKHALSGLREFSREPHSRLQLFFALIAILLSWMLNLSLGEWAVILICCASVLSLEALNSAVERLTDLLHPQYGERAKAIKDISAGAVLLSSIFALAVGLIIFTPKLIALLE